MNVKKIVAPLVLFCLFSCVLVGSGLRIEGDTLTSEYPTLSIHFKKAIADVQEKGSDRVITFMGGDPRADADSITKNTEHEAEYRYL